MSLFDVLSKGFCSKKRESNEILSQEEYKDKFLHGDEYIKRELYDEYKSSPNLCVNSSSNYISLSMLPLSSGDLIVWSLVCHSTLSYQKFCD